MPEVEHQTAEDLCLPSAAGMGGRVAKEVEINKLEKDKLVRLELSKEQKEKLEKGKEFADVVSSIPGEIMSTT